MRTIIALLLAAFVCLPASGQDKIRGSALTQITTPSGNYFIWLISTNTALGTNFTCQLSNLFSEFGLSGSNATFQTITTSNATSTTITTTGEKITYNDWQGPTNRITLGSTNFYWYTALTPCAINGVVYDASLVNRSMLTIYNAAATNITFTTIISGPQEDTSRTYTITNGFILKSWMEYAHGVTNQVTRMFRL